MTREFEHINYDVIFDLNKILSVGGRDRGGEGRKKEIWGPRKLTYVRKSRV